MLKTLERFAITGLLEDFNVDSRLGAIARRGSHSLFLTLVASMLLTVLFAPAEAQGGGFTIYGDLKVDESKVSGLRPMSFQVILESQKLSTMGRQTVPKNGRFRFENLSSGTYYIVVMMENSEVANVRVLLSGVVGTDVRKDITLEWRPSAFPGKEEKGGVVAAPVHYARTTAHQGLFEKAEESIKRQEYDRASSLLQQIVESDSKDFEAWTEFGTVRFQLKDNHEAEKDYLQALELNPSFGLALMNLGKLRLAQRNYQGAIEALTKAVNTPPPSAEANYFLGEAYLNIKKGSKAVDYMNEAIRIDPIGKAEIHLRIAAIYDSVGLKALAAAEYEQFLKKRPDYKDRKKLEKYIAENKKS
jgi:Tfp pilus assembly protein PilF